jgi:hypothetical protein
VGIVSETRQKYQRPAGATPIKHFQLYIWFDSNELKSMWGRVDLVLRMSRSYSQCSKGYEPQHSIVHFLAPALL